jgi:hypothetical protein
MGGRTISLVARDHVRPLKRLVSSHFFCDEFGFANFLDSNILFNAFSVFSSMPI